MITGNVCLIVQVQLQVGTALKKLATGHIALKYVMMGS